MNRDNPYIVFFPTRKQIKTAFIPTKIDDTSFKVIKPIENAKVTSYITNTGQKINLISVGINKDDRKIRRCWWCRYPVTGKSIGIPIEYNIDKNHRYVISTEGITCSFECSNAYIIDEKEKGFNYRNSVYKDSLIILNLFFDILYPRENFKSAEDWRILEETGQGNVSILEFRNGNHVYKRTDTVRIVYAERYYELSTKLTNNVVHYGDNL